MRTVEKGVGVPEAIKVVFWKLPLMVVLMVLKGAAGELVMVVLYPTKVLFKAVVVTGIDTLAGPVVLRKTIKEEEVVDNEVLLLRGVATGAVLKMIVSGMCVVVVVDKEVGMVEGVPGRVVTALSVVN